jgi:hypothetical protein
MIRGVVLALAFDNLGSRMSLLEFRCSFAQPSLKQREFATRLGALNSLWPEVSTIKRVRTP